MESDDSYDQISDEGDLEEVDPDGYDSEERRSALKDWQRRGRQEYIRKYGLQALPNRGSGKESDCGVSCVSGATDDDTAIESSENFEDELGDHHLSVDGQY